VLSVLLQAVSTPDKIPIIHAAAVAKLLSVMKGKVPTRRVKHENHGKYFEENTFKDAHILNPQHPRRYHTQTVLIPPKLL
jgi:hypothetical protein